MVSVAATPLVAAALLTAAEYREPVVLVVAETVVRVAVSPVVMLPELAAAAVV
jgi:hypothetical protein